MKIGNNTWVVTGAGNGIGSELALQMLSKGAIVVAADINMLGLEETRSLAGTNAQRISLYQLNNADQTAVESFAKEVIKTHHGINGIIYNAEVMHPLYS
jgi:NAD(P)-dependent dehydrogenase (short-subunit alcohol dehydrogenase family)